MSDVPARRKQRRVLGTLDPVIGQGSRSMYMPVLDEATGLSAPDYLKRFYIWPIRSSFLSLPNRAGSDELSMEMSTLNHHLRLSILTSANIGLRVA